MRAFDEYSKVVKNMGFLKKIFKKESKNNGLKVLDLFGDYNEKTGELIIENENKELEEALADTAETYLETLEDINQMTPEEKEQARTLARQEHNAEIEQLMNNDAALLLKKYQDKYCNVDREYTDGQKRVLEKGYEYLRRDIKTAEELGVEYMSLIYVNEDNESVESLVRLDEVDMYLCDEYILDMKGSFCPAIGKLGI